MVNNEVHKHKCPNCGLIWEHPETCFGDDRSHTCPVDECRGESWVHYRGRKPALVIHDTSETRLTAHGRQYVESLGE